MDELRKNKKTDTMKRIGSSQTGEKSYFLWIKSSIHRWLKLVKTVVAYTVLCGSEGACQV